VDIEAQITGENQEAKRAGIACWIYRWKLTASRIHVSPTQSYARMAKAQGVK
jgi:hypothetical protein